MKVIDFDKDNLCINQIVGQKTDNIMVEGDIIVPDVKPDILNTIHTSGNVCIYKKEVLEGKVRIDGCVNVYIMYLADGEMSSVRSLNTCLDFTNTFDFENVRPDMNLELEVEVRSVDCKVLNGRKVSVKAAVELKQKVYSNETVEYIKQIQNVEDIQLLNKSFVLNSLIGSGMNKVYAKDTLILDNIDNLAEILKVDLKITNQDTKVSYNKILAKADASVKIMYLTEDDRINVVESIIPVMGFVDIPNVSDDNLVDTKYELKNLIVKPNSVEEHSIYIEAEIELSCMVYESRNVDMIQDLYSPSQNLVFNKKAIRSMVGKERIEDVCSIRQTSPVAEIHGNRIYDVEVVPSISNQNLLNGRIVYEGEVGLKFIYSSDNGVNIDTKTMSLPFTFNVDAPNVNQSSMVETQMQIKNQNFVVMPDGNIDISIDINFIMNISKMTSINLIDSINAEENRQIEIYSIIIYYVKPGDTLWEIAKRFRSTVEDIARVNNIENPDKLNVGQQLFIPRYVRNRVST